MSSLSLVVVGPASLKALATQAGFVVAGEASDYEAACHLLQECAAGAILHEGVPRATIDPALPTVVVAHGQELSDVVGLGPFAVVGVHAEPVLIAAAVATAQAFSRAVRRAVEEASSAREELDSRKLVERAKGILMKRLGLSEEDAFRRLQKASQNENRKMRDVADSIVRTENILTENAPSAPRKRSAG